MRRTSLIATFGIAALAAAGCASAGATTPPSGATVPPLPSIVIPSLPPLPSGGIPLPSIVLPSFNSDAELAARFPQTIAGSPVEVGTFRAIDILQSADAEQRAKFDAFVSAVGVPVEAISIGFGSFTYQDSSESLGAFRAAGADGARLLNALVGFTQQAADDPATVQTTTGTIGGKPVTILTIPDDTTSYLYGAGDIVWLFKGDDAALADQVMGAIP